MGKHTVVKVNNNYLNTVPDILSSQRVTVKCQCSVLVVYEYPFMVPAEAQDKQYKILPYSVNNQHLV